jgi:hypothetical protein
VLRDDIIKLRDDSEGSKKRIIDFIVKVGLIFSSAIGTAP